MQDVASLAGGRGKAGALGLLNEEASVSRMPIRMPKKGTNWHSRSNLILKTAVRILLEHPFAPDPGTAHRLEAALDERNAVLEPLSDTGRAFSEAAKSV